MQNDKMNPKDHRSIGKRLKLFMFDDMAPGFPFWLPNGANLRKQLESILYKAHIDRNYEPVITPAMMEDTMWKVSGHYENYKENMFPSEVEKRDYLLKPMNCPMHVMIYNSDVRSYKDLPVRYFEFGQVHRNELSGALHGLFRVREFTQDDAHIVCTEEQISSEIKNVMNFVKSLLSTFDFEFEVYFSTKPKKAIGSDSVWEQAENAIEMSLKELNQPYQINEGDGAFYGPKIDIRITDIHKREWQLGTIQLDFNLPERFGMAYVDTDGQIKKPVMIHRAICGSIERFIGILLEHYSGLLPIGLAPYQVAIVPISSESEKQMTYISQIEDSINDLGGRSIVYDSNDTLNKRIKNAEQDKNPIVMIIGDNEIENKTVNLRNKIKQRRYEQSLNDFIDELKISMNIVI